MNALASNSSCWYVTALSLALVACGGDQAQPEPVPLATAEPAATAAATAEPAATGGGGPTSGGGGGSAETPKPAERPPSGRPAILMGPSAEIASTFGSTPAAVLKLTAEGGAITLKIPEYALSAGTNITWKVSSPAAAKGKAPVVGTVAYLETLLGGRKTPQAISSNGPPFELRWPTGGKDTINLAVGVVTITTPGEPGSVKQWKIYAPKNVDTGFKEAYFYLPEIGPGAYLYATTAAVAEGGG